VKIANFSHRQAAHCESGATASLINYAGTHLSEAMVFGIGAGLFFGYVPFIKVNGFPLVTYRCKPGAIFARVTKNLNCDVHQKRYRNQAQAMDDLDLKLDQGIAVGLQTSVFWLPYIPAAMRFHFNAHNLVVIGKDGDEYIISDPVAPDLVRCSAQDLSKARFARGALAPKGRSYYLTSVPAVKNLEEPIVAAIRSACRDMLAPIPIAGVRGMRLMARSVSGWETKYGKRRAGYCLAQLIRMQEEIGTGGAGFRFIYAAFLQEAAEYLAVSQLEELAEELTAIGDDWRDFALQATRCCKGHAECSYADLATMISSQADKEERFFRHLQQLTKKLG